MRMQVFLTCTRGESSAGRCLRFHHLTPGRKCQSNVHKQSTRHGATHLSDRVLELSRDGGAVFPRSGGASRSGRDSRTFAATDEHPGTASGLVARFCEQSPCRGNKTRAPASPAHGERPNQKIPAPAARTLSRQFPKKNLKKTFPGKNGSSVGFTAKAAKASGFPCWCISPCCWSCPY